MRLTVVLIALLAVPAFALNAGEQAPLFSLRDIEGRYFHLSDHVGLNKKSKGVILNFFASYCKPCRNELPVLNSLTPEFRSKGIEVVIVGFGEDFDKFEEMLSSLGVDKPTVLSDKYCKVGEKYSVRGLPKTFFIGSDGIIKDIINGELPDIEKMLREKARKLK